MAQLTAPTPRDVICDPACGTAGFLVAAGEYLRDAHPQILRDEALKEHFHHGMFHGFDFDKMMLRIGSMNLLLPGWRTRTSATATRSRRAEDLANVPHETGRGWHALRRGWASARKNLPDVDVAAAGGWTDLVSLKKSYQHADPATVFRVVIGPQRAVAG